MAAFPGSVNRLNLNFHAGSLHPASGAVRKGDKCGISSSRACKAKRSPPFEGELAVVGPGQAATDPGMRSTFRGDMLVADNRPLVTDGF